MKKYLLILLPLLFSFTLQGPPYTVDINSTSANVLFYQENSPDIRFSLLFRGLDARTMMNLYLETKKPVRSSEAFIVITKEFDDGKISFVVSKEEYKIYKKLGLSILGLTWKN